jgi:hypothetical protein
VKLLFIDIFPFLLDASSSGPLLGFTRALPAGIGCGFSRDVAGDAAAGDDEGFCGWSRFRSSYTLNTTGLEFATISSTICFFDF